MTKIFLVFMTVLTLNACSTYSHTVETLENGVHRVSDGERSAHDVALMYCGKKFLGYDILSVSEDGKTVTFICKPAGL